MKTIIKVSFITLALFVSSTSFAQLGEFDGSPNEDFMPPFEETPIAQPSEMKSSGRPYLGVALGKLSPAARSRYRMPFKHGGVLVTNVARNSPAKKAGLSTNDIIVRCNGKYVYQPKDFIQIIQKMSPGQKVQMDIYRYGKWMPIAAKLGKREAAKPKDPFSGRKDLQNVHEEDTEDSNASDAPKARRIIMKLVREIRSLRKEVNELKRQVRQLQKKTGIAHSDSSGSSGRRDDGARDSSPPTVPPPAPEN